MNPNKKDLSFGEKSLMVELASTALASVSFAVSLSYRFRLFVGTFTDKNNQKQ